MSSYFEGLKITSNAMTVLSFSRSSLLAVVKDFSKIALLNMGMTISPSLSDNADLLVSSYMYYDNLVFGVYQKQVYKFH